LTCQARTQKGLRSLFGKFQRQLHLMRVYGAVETHRTPDERSRGQTPRVCVPRCTPGHLRVYRAFTRSVELLFELTGSSVELVTCAVFAIHPPAVPVIVVVSVNEALAPLARDGRLHVTTRVDAA